MTSGGEWVIGPQTHAVVARRARKLERLVDEPAPEAMSTTIGLDEQDPQLCRRVAVAGGDAEDAADAPAVDFGDPGRLALRIVVAA